MAATIPAPDGPWAALVEDGSVWVEAHRGIEIYRIDPATATVTATAVADVSGQFDHDGALRPGVGGPWVAPDSDATGVHLWVHIDAATNLASTPAGLQHALSTLGLGANAVAETADGLWAVAPDRGSFDVVLFDRQKGTELRRIQIASLASPGPRFLDAAFGSLWVTGYGDHTMEKVDPSTGRLVSAVALAATPIGVIVGDSALYVAGADGSVARIDPDSQCVTALAFVGGVATDPATGDGDTIYLASSGDAVDVGYDRGAVAILDATTLAVREAFRVDNQDFQGGLAATTGTIWYPTFGDNSVLEVKP